MELHTLETFAKKENVTKDSAINKLVKLRKKGLVKTSGGGKQPKLYKLLDKPEDETNGFYDIVNKYSPEKLQPKFKHYVYGKYKIENAIIEGLVMSGYREKEAIKHLFRHVNDWKLLMNLAKKKSLDKYVHEVYKEAKKTTRVKKMPRRYIKDDK